MKFNSLHHKVYIGQFTSNSLHPTVYIQQFLSNSLQSTVAKLTVHCQKFINIVCGSGCGSVGCSMLLMCFLTHWTVWIFTSMVLNIKIIFSFKLWSLKVTQFTLKLDVLVLHHILLGSILCLGVYGLSLVMIHNSRAQKVCDQTRQKFTMSPRTRRGRPRW